MAVVAKAQEVLDLKRLKLPAELPVLSLEVEDYVDWYGKDALRVWVTIPEDLDVTRVSGDAVVELKRAIHHSLIENGIDLFPYVSIAKRSERS